MIHTLSAGAPFDYSFTPGIYAPEDHDSAPSLLVLTEHGGNDHTEVEDAWNDEGDSCRWGSCEGVPLEWDAGPILKTLPWHLFEDSADLGFYITALRDKGTRVFLRANTCTGVPVPSTTACASCVQVPKLQKLTKMQKRAQSANQENWQYENLTYEQAVRKLREKSELLRVERSKVRVYYQAVPFDVRAEAELTVTLTVRSAIKHVDYDEWKRDSLISSGWWRPSPVTTFTVYGSSSKSR